jgi:hypothetical protein
MLMKFRGDMAAFAATLALLGACASKAPKDLDLAKNPSEGVVVFAVSHEADAGRGVTLMVYLDRNPLLGTPPYRSVEDVAGIRTGSDFGDDYGRLEVVNLNAGRHSFSFWKITNGTGLRILPDKDLPPLEFDVKAGSIVYLGDFHGMTVVGRNLFGMKITGGGYPVLRDRHARDVPIFEAKYPQFRGHTELALLPQGPWVSGAVRQQLEAPPAATR